MPIPPLPGADDSAADVLPFGRGTIKREHFIPLRKADLVALLGRQPGLSPRQRESFGELCRLLEATFHFDFHKQLEALKDAYAPFDPDADTQSRLPADTGDDVQRLSTLFEKLTWLLERGNFQALSSDDLQAALAAMSNWGLNLEIDFTAFERLEVYARGDGVIRRRHRGWRTWFRWREAELPVYRRLVVAFQLRDHACAQAHTDAGRVYLKIFKDIPHADLEMLLPGGRVKISLTDRTKIFLPTVSGLAMSAAKLVQGVAALAAAGVYGLLGFLGLLGGTVGYGVRSYFGYLSKKQKYQLSLTESLYYQNLDNNAGVLFRLLDEAEEQECREALLAYFFLWRFADAAGWTTIRLDAEIENFLAKAAGLEVDFEIDDALEKLVRFGLVSTTPDGRYRAAPIEEALQKLDRSWDNLFSYNRAG